MVEEGEVEGVPGPEAAEVAEEVLEEWEVEEGEEVAVEVETELDPQEEIHL